MITLLGALLGFISSIAPDIFKLLRGRQDNVHELAVMQLQIEASKAAGQQRLEEINTQADAAVMQAVYRNARPTGVKWVDALAGSVRPIITYCFFFSYVAVKVSQYHALAVVDLPWLGDAAKAQAWFQIVLQLWSEEDQALFAAVMAFWFGDRSLKNRR